MLVRKFLSSSKRRVIRVLLHPVDIRHTHETAICIRGRIESTTHYLACVLKIPLRP
jgi:hypothetical protein